jgi:hypothetical protein
MTGSEGGTVLTWIVGQPVALAFTLIALGMASWVIRALFLKNQSLHDEKLAIAREVFQVTAAATLAMESNTDATRETGRAVDRLAEQRSRSRG